PVLQSLLVPNPGHRPPADQIDRMLAQAAATGDTAPEHPVYQQYSGQQTVTSPQDFVPPQPFPTAPHSQGFATVQQPQGFTPPPAYLPVDKPPAARQRNSRPWILAGAAALVAVAVVAAIALWPSSSSSGQGQSGLPTDQPTGITLPSGVIPPTVFAPTTAKAAAVDLLTPDGMRKAIAALEKVTGGKQFTETTIYPTYVITGAPVANEPKHYDKFTYRDGTAKRDGVGGQLTDPTLDLSSINGDILPTLLATATQQLKVPNPTSRYIIVDTAGTFSDGQPVLRVYLSTDYGDGGYVSAALDGTILRTYGR
ncbi:hypothetical protein, partial [Nocardia sp. JMUB6875]|uniref:hypothetical protein n=1 Tax=Nocardia sp. JMUB6875 TaxID=3158170 RepID=UPI0034E87AF5